MQVTHVRIAVLKKFSFWDYSAWNQECGPWRSLARQFQCFNVFRAVKFALNGIAKRLCGFQIFGSSLKRGLPSISGWVISNSNRFMTINRYALGATDMRSEYIWRTHTCMWMWMCMRGCVLHTFHNNASMCMCFWMCTYTYAIRCTSWPGV